MITIRAEFFDIFGVASFLYLMFIGIFLYAKYSLPMWISSSILAIAIIGLVVDSTIVTKTYGRKIWR